MNKYISHRRFKGESISGAVNIPAQTPLAEFNGVLFWGEKAICTVVSENAHQYFAINNDGNGLLRGALTQAIQSALRHPASADKATMALAEKRWDRVWANKLCATYKRTEYNDFWLWNHEFFGAPIFHLQYIANLVEAKLKK